MPMTLSDLELHVCRLKPSNLQPREI